MLEHVEVTEADLVVLAGDIDTKLHGIDWAVDEARRLAKPIVYVLGNHEYYGGHLEGLLGKARERSRDTGVHLLEQDQLLIDGARILGCTLWTDFQLHGQFRWSVEEARSCMTDFRRIRWGPRYQRLSPAKLVGRHADARRWLEQCLAEPFVGPTVVVTHHAPSAQSIEPAWRGSPLAPAYASELSEFIDGHPIDCWVHGHLHTRSDYHLGNTRVVANPRGYFPGELNPRFDPRAVVEIAAPTR